MSSTKGYSLLELLVCLFIISIMSYLTLRIKDISSFEHYDFLNDYLIRQSETIMNKTSDSYIYGISFNEMGHVNQGRTISFDNHEVIIHLGNGYATYR